MILQRSYIMIILILFIIIVIFVVIFVTNPGPTTKKSVSFKPTTEVLEYDTVSNQNIKFTRGKLTDMAIEAAKKDVLTDIVKFVGAIAEDAAIL